jgi:hypothetical protein
MFQQTPDTSETQMYVCFLPASDSIRKIHWLNRAAAYFAYSNEPLDHTMIHTELLFAEVEPSDIDTIVGQSCSIHYDGTVFLEPKTFSRKEWHFRQCPPEWCPDKALTFCENHRGDKFNKIGYYVQPLCRARMSSNRWFCSEIVAGALRAAGADVHTSLHPHQLFLSLKDVTFPACPKQTDMKF